jgi:hypothetical protein
MSSVVIAAEHRRPICAIGPHPKQVIAAGTVVRAALTTYGRARPMTRDPAPTPLRPAAAAAEVMLALGVDLPVGEEWCETAPIRKRC